MITLKLAGQIVDLEGDEVIACSYSIFPIGNISKRSAFKSVEFQLPMTANNKEIIENNQIIVNNSILPFQFIPATLEADGVDQKIISAQLVSIKDTIKIRLFGGNIDFYNLIKDLKLRDLDLSDLDHVWDLSLLAWRNLRFNTSGVIYPVVDFHADSPNAFVDNITSQINARYMYPAIFRHTLITRIIEGVGFTLQGDFLSNADYLSTLIQTHTTVLNDQYKSYLFSIGESTKTITALPPSADPFTQVIQASIAGSNQVAAIVLDNHTFDPFFLLTDVPIDLTQVFVDRFGSAANIINPPLTRTGTRYTAKYAGDYEFKLTLKYTVTNVDPLSPFRLELWKNNTFVDFANIPSGIEYVFEYPLTLAKGDFFHFVVVGSGNVNSNSNIYTILPGTKIEFTKAPETYGYGEDTTMAVNLPDMSQADFILDTVIKFGLMLQVDNENMVVRFRQFSEIIANKPIAKDWSDKVDYTEKPEIKFDSEYGQINEYKYSDDDSVVKPPGTDYELVINNQLLPPRKTIFQSKFAATEKVVRFIGKEINQIKLISEAGTDNQEENSIKYRELILARQDFVLTVVDGSASTTWSTEIPTTRFIKDGEAFNLGFGNLLPRFSGDIIALVQDFRTSVQLLRLNTLDINQLDFFIPVWIERNGEPGCYFYISEINQFKFTSVESVDVELCKLP